MTEKDDRALVQPPKKLKNNAIEILDMISEGADEKSVCDHFSIRRGTFVQWMITFPQFENAVIEARKQRADSYRSIIQRRMCDDSGNIVAIDKEDVPGEKLIFEKLKWLAEVDNPEKFGTRVKHEGNMTMPVQIVVDTGIRTKEDKDQPIEAEAEEVVEDYSKSDF